MPADQTQVNEILLDLLKTSDTKLDTCVTTIAKIDTKMDTLIGPDGRVPKLETQVMSHNKALWVILGLTAAGLAGESAAHGPALWASVMKIFLP